MNRIRIWLCALACCALAACGGGGSDGPQPLPPAVTATVSAAGSDVEVALAQGGSATLAFPAGAFADDREVTSTVNVVQSVGGEVISTRGLLSSHELGFALAPDGTLTFLGVAAKGAIDRDAKGVPLSWEPFFWRFEGALTGRDLLPVGYFPTDYLAQRWELTRP